MPDPVVPESDQTIVLRAAQATVLLASFELAPPFEPRLVLLKNPSSEQATAYRVLRHRLRKKGDPRVVMVTSARPGEGKTTCAVNLALAIAEESNDSVLYLDANLARPALPSLFEIHDQRGVLSGAIVRAYPVLAVPGSGLRLATALDPGAESARFDPSPARVVISDLREAYDYIVIDAASVLEGSDANLLAELSDAVVLTARAGRSHRRSLTHALERLDGAPVLGGVLLDS